MERLGWEERLSASKFSLAFGGRLLSFQVESNFDKRDENKPRRTSRLETFSRETLSGRHPVYDQKGRLEVLAGESRLSLVTKMFEHDKNSERQTREDFKGCIAT